MMERGIVEFMVRSVLIAAGTAVVLRMLRVKMAAARHWAWTGVVLLMTLLPLWTAWGPKASLRVLPAITVRAVSPAMPPAKTAATFAAVAPTTASAPRPRHAVWSWPSFLTGIYLLGVCVLLTRLAVGTARAHALVRRATNRGGRLTSDACAAPVTVGWLKPSVILPECWPAWSEAQLDAVLTHEGEHARRRDPMVQGLALLNRALFWFHPLAWWLEFKLSALAEEACDAAVLGRGHDPFEYAEYLLEIARSVLRTGVRIKILGMAMPGSFLPQRIRRILEGGPAPRISRVRMMCLGAACAMVSAVFTAGAVDRRVYMSARGVIPEASLVEESLAQSLTYDTPQKATARTALPAQATDRLPVPAATAAEPQDKFKDRRMVVLYFDLRGMPAIERSRVFASAEGFIRTQMQTTDLLAIMTASQDVKVSQDFTDDRDQLLQRLARLATDSGLESDALFDADRQMASLHIAVNMLGQLSGKKAVVYFATGFERSDSAELRPLIDDAIRANVAFYLADSQGLMQNPSVDARQRQVDEALQKLWELARRQQELADQEKERPQASAEQRWQQEMLRREAEQLQQKLDQLNRSRRDQPAAIDQTYVIGAEDTIQIGVSQQHEISGQYVVRPDGMISVPLIGSIRAAGLTAPQLEAVIADRLEAFLKQPAATVGVVAVHKPIR